MKKFIEIVNDIIDRPNNEILNDVIFFFRKIISYFKLVTLPEHPSSPLAFSGVSVAQSVCFLCIISSAIACHFVQFLLSLKSSRQI